MALTKIDDRGLKTPIDLLDNEKIRLGTGNDLELYHDGSHSYIKGSTGFTLVYGATGVALQPKAGEYSLYGAADGETNLYYDGSKSFETTSTGAGVLGNATTCYLILKDTDGNYCWQLVGYDASSAGAGGRLVMADADGNTVMDMRDAGTFIQCKNSLRLDVDNLKLELGAGQDFQLWHDGTNNFIKGDGPLYFGKKSAAEYTALFIPGGGATLYHDNSARIATTAAGVTVTGTLVADGLTVDGDVTLTGAANNVVWDKSDNALEFVDSAKAVFGQPGNDLTIRHDGSNSYIHHDGAGHLIVKTTGSGEDLYIQANNDIHLEPQTNESGLQIIGDGGVIAYYDGSVRFSTISAGTYFHEKQLGTGGGCKFRTYGGSVGMSASTNHDTLLTQDFGNDDMVRIEYAYNWNDGDGGAWGSAIAWNEHDSANMRTRFLGEEISSPGSSVEFVKSGNSLSFRFTTGGSGMNGEFMIIAYSKGCDLY